VRGARRAEQSAKYREGIERIDQAGKHTLGNVLLHCIVKSSNSQRALLYSIHDCDYRRP